MNNNEEGCATIVSVVIVLAIIVAAWLVLMEGLKQAGKAWEQGQQEAIGSSK